MGRRLASNEARAAGPGHSSGTKRKRGKPRKLKTSGAAAEKEKLKLSQSAAAKIALRRKEKKRVKALHDALDRLNPIQKQEFCQMIKEGLVNGVKFARKHLGDTIWKNLLSTGTTLVLLKGLGYLS